MNDMKKLLLFLFLIPGLLAGQTLDRIPKSVSVKYNLIVIKPTAYDGVKAFPVVVFLPGIGAKENTNFTTSANLTQLEAELHPQVKTAANVEGGFLIVTVQTPDFYDDEIGFALDYLIKNYKCDTSFKGLTGWSYGGAGTWLGAFKYLGRFNAIAPIAAAWTTPGNWATLASSNTAIWAFHNLNDPNGGTKVDVTKTYVKYFNDEGPAVKAAATYFADNSHGTGAAYDNSTPPYAPGGEGLTNPTKTLWQWFLMNKGNTRVEPPAATIQTGLVPVAKASISNNIVALDGRASVGYKSGVWSTVNVPADVSIYAVQACGWITCNVTLPKPGNYTFRLTVKDAAGVPKTEDVTVTYSAAVVVPPPVPPVTTDYVTTSALSDSLRALEQITETPFTSSNATPINIDTIFIAAGEVITLQFQTRAGLNTGNAFYTSIKTRSIARDAAGTFRYGLQRSLSADEWLGTGLSTCKMMATTAGTNMIIIQWTGEANKSISGYVKYWYDRKKVTQ